MIRFTDDKAVGEFIAGGITKILHHKPDALICIAAGTTSFPVFDALLRRLVDRFSSVLETGKGAIDG